MTRTEEEAGLVLRAREGSQDDMSALLTLYRERILRFCIARMGDVDAAEDATQETLVAMVEAVKRFRGDASAFSTYVFGIASNKVRMAQRAGGRRDVPTTISTCWVRRVPRRPVGGMMGASASLTISPTVSERSSSSGSSRECRPKRSARF